MRIRVIADQGHMVPSREMIKTPEQIAADANSITGRYLR